MNEFATKLADRTATTIEPFSSEDDNLLIAHEIIAKVRMIGFMPRDERVAEGGFGAEDVSVLRAALLEYSRTHPEHPTRGTAYWGIAALHDSNEIGLLRDLLKLESTRKFVDEDVLWQIMIALDNIGEDVLKPIQGNPLEQPGDRWAASRLYLARNKGDDAN